MAHKNTKKEVIALLSDFNESAYQLIRTKSMDKQTLGLLAKAIRINRRMVKLLNQDKLGIEFVRQGIPLTLFMIKELFSKWLSRYQLTPSMAQNVC
jgi:hypothetical protein